MSSQDPCTYNRELSEPTRSVEYTLAPTDPDLCDRIITEGWYRVPENGNANIIVRVEDIVWTCTMSSTLTTIWQSLLTQHYYYYYSDCYMQTKYIENYYNKGGPDIGD